MNIETTREIAKGAVWDYLSYSIDDLLDSADTQVEKLIKESIREFVKNHEGIEELSNEEMYKMINLIWNNITLSCDYTSGDEDAYGL